MLATLLALTLAAASQDRSATTTSTQDPTAGMTDGQRAEHEHWQRWLRSEPGVQPPRFGPGVQDRPAPSYAPTFRGSVYAGMRFLGEDWHPADRQPAIGFELEVSRPDLPISLELGIAGSRDGGSTSSGSVDVDISEVYAGGRWWWIDIGSDVRLYTSAGVALVEYSSDGTVPDAGGSVDDTVPALYGRLGGVWPIGRGMTFGIDYRHSFVQDVEDNGADLESDSGLLSFVLGFDI